MRDQRRILPIPIEHHAIRSRTSSAIHLVRIQNRELVPWSGYRKAEAFVVVVLVRVVVAPERIAGLI